MPKRTLLIIVAAALVVVLGGVALLATVEIPAPTARIERTIPNDSLPR